MHPWPLDDAEVFKTSFSSHPFFSRLKKTFKDPKLNNFCEALCQPLYADGIGFLLSVSGAGLFRTDSRQAAN